MLLSFIVATIIVCLMPGPSMILIIVNTINRGLGAGIATTVGAVLADAILLVLSLSSVGAVLYASPLAFNLLKWFGVGYLIYLGVMELKSSAGGGDLGSARAGNAFLQGLGTTLLNPKIIGFLIVFFPQFIDQSANVPRQLLVLGPLFLLIVLIIFLGCAVAARLVQTYLTSARGREVFRNVSGVSLIGCGLLSAAL